MRNKAELDVLISTIGGRVEFINFAREKLTVGGKPISRACVYKWLSGVQPIPDQSLELLRILSKK
jgi:hypothetical protein